MILKWNRSIGSAMLINVWWAMVVMMRMMLMMLLLTILSALQIDFVDFLILYMHVAQIAVLNTEQYAIIPLYIHGCFLRKKKQQINRNGFELVRLANTCFDWHLRHE